MAIIKEEIRNGVTVRIHDDFCRDKDFEAIQQILKRIAVRAQADLTAETTESERRHANG